MSQFLSLVGWAFLPNVSNFFSCLSEYIGTLFEIQPAAWDKEEYGNREQSMSRFVETEPR